MKHEKFSEIKKIIEFDPLDNDYKPRIGCVECSLLGSVCMSRFRIRRQRRKMKTLWKKIDILMEWRKRR